MSRKLKRLPQDKQKKKGVRTLKAEDYSRVLNEMGEHVEYAAEISATAIIMIRPSKKDGRPIVLTNAMYFDDSKNCYPEFQKEMKTSRHWATWDIFGP